jgi:hypothetical protein
MWREVTVSKKNQTEFKPRDSEAAFHNTTSISTASNEATAFVSTEYLVLLSLTVVFRNTRNEDLTSVTKISAAVNAVFFSNFLYLSFHLE